MTPRELPDAPSPPPVPPDAAGPDRDDGRGAPVATAGRATAGERATLDRSLAHGVAWMGSVKWLTQLLTWVSTILVARLLTPADYGLVGLASMYLGIVTLLSEFGIGTTIVTMRGLSERDIAQINTLSLLFGVASFAVSCAVAPLLADFFDAPQLTWVVIAMASMFVISAMRVVPGAILQRDMRFRDLAINEGVQALLLSVGAVAFAALGFRYWTLVLSSILGILISTIGVLRLVRVPFEWPQWSRLAPAVTFSRQTILGRLAWYVYRNADFFIAGKLLGKDALGAYRFGWDLADAPVEKLTSLVGRVTPAILSASQSDPAALRRYVLRISETLALATFPACLGLALVANNLVPLALGEKWVEMITPLQLLAIAAAIRSVTPIFPQVLVVTGRNRLMMYVNIVGAIVMPLAFWLASRWGTDGIALMWVTVYPLLVALPMGVVAARQIALGAGEYVRALAPPTTSAALMCGAVLGVRLLLPPDLPRPVALATDIAVGAAGYAGALLLFHRARLRQIVSKIRGAMT